MSKKTFLWCHSYSKEQFVKMQRIRHMRSLMSLKLAEKSAYCRIQPTTFKEIIRVHSKPIMRSSDGTTLSVHMDLFPLRFHYALRLYEQALTEAHELFPNLDEHYFEDGADIGERKLRFTSTRHQLAIPFIISRIQELADSANLQVGGFVQKSSPDQWGTVRHTVYIDKDIEWETYTAVENQLATHGTYQLNTTPRFFTFNDIQDFFTELSLPELLLLNIEDSFAPLSIADTLLIQACKQLNPQAIKKALAQGANPNTIDRKEGTPLLVIAQHSQAIQWQTPCNRQNDMEAAKAVPFVIRKECIDLLVAAGASLDIYNPLQDHCSALMQAALYSDEPLFAYLLSLGADDTSKLHEDDRPSMFNLPTVWDHCASECDNLLNEAIERSERIWNILRNARQSPSGIKPGDKPD